MDPQKMTAVNLDKYINFLNQIKSDIQQTQLRAALSVTHELTNLYWRIGKSLCEKILEEGWGAKTIERISKDISFSFPNISGFSYRNLYFMRQFAEGDIQMVFLKQLFHKFHGVIISCFYKE